MKLRELLQEMQATQKQVGSSEVYICGGTPRDRYLKHLENISDVDVTTGDKTIQILSQEFGQKLAQKFNIFRKTFDDGHSAIHIGKFKMDFSSNFNVEGIDVLLAKMGVKDITEMKKEMFSRDFTCNSLLLSLDLQTVLDPTDRGFKDLDDKVIRTCLDPAVTLTTNKNRVVRAIYLASKLGFAIDDKIVAYVQKNPDSVKISTDKVMNEKLNEAFTRDPDAASFWISKMGLWNHIPIGELARPYYQKQSVMKKAYFQGGGGVNEPTPGKKKYKSDPALVNQPRFEEPLYRNYDLYDTPGKHSPGAGYHSLQKYKSVSEFLEAKRKKLKDKYKADDSWIQDDGSITKKNPNKIKARAHLISQILKVAIDFPIDSQVTPIGYEGDSTEHSLQMGGMGMPLDPLDFEGKPSSQLNYGRDYTEDDEPSTMDPDMMELMMDKYLNHEPKTELFGLPDGFDHSEEEDIASDNSNPEYGTVGPDSLIYEDKWNV